MGKAGKWIKHLLTGKKDKDKEKKNNTIGTTGQVDETVVVNGHSTRTITIPPTPPAKEKRRWGFGRSSATTPPTQQPQESETEHNAVEETGHNAVEETGHNAVEESAAIKIQSFYRGYISRKALNALRGLVKLQALVRGHIVRKQAAATLRCMQALIKVQSRARAQRLHVVEESKSYNHQKLFNRRKSSQDFRRHSYQELEIGMEENLKIVEVDPGDSKPNMRRGNSYSSHENGQIYPFEHIISPHKTRAKHDQEIPSHGYGQMYPFEHTISTQKANTKHEQELSPSLSSRTDLSPRTSSGHFQDYSFNTPQSSAQNSSRTPINYAISEYAELVYRKMKECPQFYPSYMANTQSSKAKVRSHSAPKSRPETYERQSSGRRRPSIEGRNVPRGIKMQKSSSQVVAEQNYQYPWSIKLDQSTVSLKDSECGSNSTVFTAY